jgi:hypothetical protein
MEKTEFITNEESYDNNYYYTPHRANGDEGNPFDDPGDHGHCTGKDAEPQNQIEHSAFQRQRFREKMLGNESPQFFFHKKILPEVFTKPGWFCENLIILRLFQHPAVRKDYNFEKTSSSLEKIRAFDRFFQEPVQNQPGFEPASAVSKQL